MRWIWNCPLYHFQGEERRKITSGTLTEKIGEGIYLCKILQWSEMMGKLNILFSSSSLKTFLTWSMKSKQEKPIQACGVSRQCAPEGCCVSSQPFPHQMTDTSLEVFIEIQNGKRLKSTDLGHTPKPISTVEATVSLLQPRQYTQPISLAGQCPVPSLDVGNSWSWWVFCSGYGGYPFVLCLSSEKINEEIFFQMQQPGTETLLS